MSGGAEDRIATLSADNFDRAVLQAGGPVAVEFMAYSCGHCGVMEPVLQQAVAMLDSKVTIFRVNTEIDPDLALRFDVTGTPTFILFLDGGEVGRLDGVAPDLASVVASLTRPFA